MHKWINHYSSYEKTKTSKFTTLLSAIFADVDTYININILKVVAECVININELDIRLDYVLWNHDILYNLQNMNGKWRMKFNISQPTKLLRSLSIIFTYIETAEVVKLRNTYCYVCRVGIGKCWKGKNKFDTKKAYLCTICRRNNDLKIALHAKTFVEIDSKTDINIDSGLQQKNITDFLKNTNLSIFELYQNYCIPLENLLKGNC